MCSTSGRTVPSEAGWPCGRLMRCGGLIQARRSVILATVGITLATAIAFAGAAFWGWRYGLGTHDKVLVLNTVVAAGAFVLVAWGVIVALVTYVSATGAPNLSAEVTFRFSFPIGPTFSAADRAESIGEWKTVAAYRQTEGEVRVTNNSKYSARNPGVRMTLDGLGGIASQEGWAIIGSANQIGITCLQWDGGADYIIHGQWSRVLPPLNVDGMFAVGANPALIVDVAADGFGPKQIRLPVRILDAEEYGDYSNERARYFNENSAIEWNDGSKFDQWRKAVKKDVARASPPSLALAGDESADEELPGTDEDAST